MMRDLLLHQLLLKQIMRQPHHHHHHHQLQKIPHHHQYTLLNQLRKHPFIIIYDISNVLSQLVVNHDSRILFDYEDYDKNQQGENLIDKLLKVATIILKEEAGSISKAHGITSSYSNNKSTISTNRTNIDKYDTADDKIISESDSSMNADIKKASFCSLSKTNAISNQKTKYDEDND